MMEQSLSVAIFYLSLVQNQSNLVMDMTSCPSIADLYFKSLHEVVY